VTGDALTEKYGRTGPLIIRWIEEHLPEARFSWVHIAGNVTPPKPAEMDGVIISGSEKGVYDDTPWMAPLRENIQQLHAAGVAMFGICFGHQIMADVFGGKAEKADKGFVAGSRPFDVDGKQVNAYLAHQDQVTQAPPNASVTATAAHCPVAALAYDFPAASVQFHPEYDREFAADLIDMFGAELMPDEQLRASRDSLSAQVPDELWCAEVARFFREHCGQA
jgi:GMP synthase-like glutamine amidotransferase